LLSIFGLSDHWKDSSKDRQRVISNMTNNEALKSAAQNSNEYLLVSGHAFSKLGAIDHLEFLSADYITISVLEIALGFSPSAKVYTVDSNSIFENGILTNRKTKESIIIKDNVYLYDTKSNLVLKMDKINLQNYLSGIPTIKRHWVQLLSPNSLIMKIVGELGPRYRYAN
jgi:hypothetical protein